MPTQDDDDDQRLPREWCMLPAFPLLGVAAGILLGVVTNAINGKVSPLYFERVMGWFGRGHTAWAAAIGQGAIEGALMGLGFGIAFGIIVAATTGLRCLLPAVARSFCLAIATVLICWASGGVIGLAAAAWKPSWIVWTTGLQPSRQEEIAIRWVGGSILGAKAGAAIAVVVAGITNWRYARTFNAPPAFAVLPPQEPRLDIVTAPTDAGAADAP